MLSGNAARAPGRLSVTDHEPVYPPPEPRAHRRLLAESHVANDPVRHKSLVRLLAEEEAKDTKSHDER